MQSLPNFPNMLPASRRHLTPEEANEIYAETTDGLVVAAWHGTIQVLDREFSLILALRESRPITSTSSSTASMTAPATKPTATVLSTQTERARMSHMDKQTSCIEMFAQEDALIELIHGKEETLKVLWKQSRDVNGFLLEFTSILSRLLQSNHPSATSSTAAPSSLSSSRPPLNSSGFFESLSYEILQLPSGWKCVENMNETCHEFDIVYTDLGHRKHLMHVKLSDLYPRSPPVISVQLPLPLDLQLPLGLTPHSKEAQTSSIKTYYDRWHKSIQTYQLFWNLLDDLDKNAWILEPERPIPKSANRRRIAIEKSCSLELSINPLNPTGLPELRTFGEESIAHAKQSIIHARLALWEIPSNTTPIPSDFLRKNLLRVLDMSELPKPTETNREQFSLECQICDSYQLDDNSLPDLICKTPSCRRQYHVSCLRQWFESINIPVTMGYLQGECTICKQKIVVNAT